MLETTGIHVTCLQTGGIHLEIEPSPDASLETAIYEQLLPYFNQLANVSINIPVMSLPHFDEQVKGEWFAYYLIYLVLTTTNDNTVTRHFIFYIFVYTFLILS